MIKLKIQYVVAFLLALLAIPAWAVQELTVAMSQVEDLKAVFATVETTDVASARARIGGTVTSLDVDEGSVVRQGQSIALVGDPKLGLRMDALSARIQSMTAQRKLSKTTLDRARKLRQSGTIPQKGLDEAQTALDVIERNLLALQAERAVVVQQREEGVVLAPSAGRVTKVHITRGAVILPGEVVATIAARGYILRLNLPERHARFIKVGDKVLVGEDISENRTGHVQQVYPEIRQGRVVADVAVEGLGDFFVGERIRVRVGAGQRSVILIPGEYLFNRYGLTFATLKGGSEIVVQPGQNRGEQTEILSGLRLGDVLVLPGAE
jgi:membrane fusion protein, multidrug efflux system